MKIVPVGATGFVGSALLREALDRGDVVTAFARHPEAIAPEDCLAVKTSDIYDVAALTALLAGNEAVITAFNPDGKNSKRYEGQNAPPRPLLLP